MGSEDEHGDSDHLRLIRRWLSGEVVNGSVGIKIVGGPLDGKTKIVALDDEALPPVGFRAGSAGVPGFRSTGARHTYLATRVPGAVAGWVYEYAGADTLPQS
ncbi:hypothetical protein [Streptomyces sp. NPDC048659]|uniref:hypothetical protein n=1 Tax=Streptomyces sp. NPDC048659 TaxID=3155489 RepID=UPI00341D7DB9